MGTLAFRTHDPAIIAPQLEGRLRAEIGEAMPIPFQIGDQKPSAGFRDSEVFRSLTGGRSTPHLLFLQHFEFSSPRPATLDVDINKQHLTSYVGSLIYCATLQKSVGAEIHLETGKPPHFMGDDALCSRLNGQAELLKSAGNFLRNSLTVGAQAIHIQPFLRVIPYQGHSIVISHTLPKSTNLGFSSILDAKDWFSLLGKIEAAL